MDTLNKVNGDKNLYDRVCWWMTEYDDWQAKMDLENPDYMQELIKQAMDIFYDVYQTCGYEREAPIDPT